MSINNLGQKRVKIIHFGLLVVFVCSLIGLFRQVSIYLYTSRSLVAKERELQELERKNQALKVRFEEVQQPEFLVEQAEKLLGMGNPKKEVLPRPTSFPEPIILVNEKEITKSNFQKWVGLFFY